MGVALYFGRTNLNHMPSHDPKFARSLFKAGHLRELAVYKSTQTLRKAATDFQATTPKEVFEAAYNCLHTFYPVEYVLKNELLKWLRSTSPDHTYIRTEYWMRRTRTDVIAVGDTATAYEIKTRYDSPSRLKEQIKQYSTIFPYVVLVTESKFTNKFYKLTPDWVGLSVIDKNGGLRVVEEPKKHTANLKRFCILEGMLKAQKVDMLKRLMPERKHRHRDTLFLSSQLGKTMTPEELSDEYRHSVRHSVYRPMRHLKFVDELPGCFTTALYDYWLTVQDLKSLIEMMDTPINELICKT